MNCFVNPCFSNLLRVKTMTKASLLLGLMALAFAAVPIPAKAALVKGDIIAAEGDLVPPNNEPISNVRIPMEDGAGRPVFTGVLDNATSGPEAFLWYDSGVIWRNSNDLSLELGNLETLSGASATGQFFVSPSVGGLDSVYSNAGPLLVEDEPAPGIPGKLSAFNSRPRMTSEGVAWWIGGYTTNPGGLTEGRILYRATDASDPGTITPIITEGDVVDGITIDDIDFNYDISDNSDNFIAIIVYLSTEAVLLNSDIIAEETLPAGDSEFWQDFDIVGVNNAGTWFIVGDTTGAAATDERIMVNGAVQVREGDVVDGVTLTTPASVVAAAINNNCLMAHIWSADGTDTLFVGYANSLDQSKAILQNGDDLDIDNDNIADFVVTNINHNTTSDYGLDLGDNGVIYLRLTLEPSGGGSDFDAIVRLTIDQPNPLVVTNVDDSGFGSLRNAIEFANGKCGADTITFDLPSTSPRTIQPLSPLPAITEPLVIDASADSDSPCSPTVEIDGSLAGPSHGFTILADFCEIRGFVINNWEYAGIWVDSYTSNTIQCNYIGTDFAGTAAAPNAQSGIITWGSQKTKIGGDKPGEGNLISGNDLHGIHMVENTSGTLVMGNLIGTDVTGLAALPNTLIGVRVDFSDFNFIGGQTPEGGNIISGNGAQGIFIFESERTSVGNNFIGVDATGLAPLGNAMNGVAIDSQSNQTIVAINVISGNGLQGVVINNQSNGSFVFENIIGLDADALSPIPNGQHGVMLETSDGCFVAFNIIGANLGHGVLARKCTQLTIGINTVGLDGTGVVARPNDSGIVLDNCSNNPMGVFQNISSGNNSYGVWLTNNTSDTVVLGNRVGIDENFTLALGNGKDGILIQDSTQNELRANFACSNVGVGINLVNSSFNMLELNFAGLGSDLSTTVFPFPNGLSGVKLSESSDNQLQTTITGFNNGHGIEIVNNSDRNTLIGAFAGSLFFIPGNMGNALDGIHVADSIDNVLGGPGFIEAVVANYNGGDGIELNNADYTFVQNGRIGIDLLGTAAEPNLGNGIAILNSSESIDIKDSVISGNNVNGIYVANNGTQNNDIVNCIIGLNAMGDAAVPNGQVGVYLINSRHTRVENSFISGNAAGIVMSSSNDNEVYGNKIGTDATGAVEIENSFGVRVLGNSRNNKIGGPGLLEGNLISGNKFSGVDVVGENAINNIVQGNIIGADVSGNAPLPNYAGVMFDGAASMNLVGGLGVGEGNLIAFNHFAGVDVGTSSTAITIFSNNIRDNGGLGIDLRNIQGSPDPNDPLDADEGANNGQNYPVLYHDLPPCEPVDLIGGDFESEANTSYTIQLFWSQVCDPSGFGEGAVHFDTFQVLTNGAGYAPFSRAVGPYAGGFITATATNNLTGDTSEFSECLGVGDFAPPAIVCPADIEVPGIPGACEAFVNVPQPEVNDDCTSTGLLVVTNDFTGTDDATGVYPGGTTIVTWTVEDQGGNTTQCQQLITVTCVAECTLDPAFAVNPVETTHTVTLTVTLNGATPLTSGTLVLFEIVSGPNAPTSGTAALDILGQATFSYFGSGGNGTDTIRASGGGIGFEFTCEAEKEWEGGEPTPTPTATPTPTPSPTPDTTVTPTPTPSPTPCTPSDFQFEGTDDGWTTGGAPLTFDLPAFGQTASALTVDPNGFFTFGFWQSPAGAITGALGDHMYAVRFNLAWDQTPCEAPTLRLRAIAQDFTQLEVLGVNSTGDCSVAPGATAKDYVMHFIPQQGGVSNDFIVALDTLAFDPFDSPAGTLSIDYVDIHCFPLSAFTFDPMLTYNFAGSDEGWTTGSAQLLTPPVFESTGLGLSMRSTNNVTTFGYWQSPASPVMSTAGRALVGQYEFTSPPVIVGTAASVRLRMITADGQGFRYTEFPAVPKLVGSEGVGPSIPPTIVYEAPAGADVNLTFDLINFNLLAAEEFEVVLTGVAVTETDAPVLP